MSINSIQKTLRLAIAAVAIIAAAPAIIFAQGETFTDCDAWTAAICGNIIDDDFESVVGFPDNPIPEPGTGRFSDPVPNPQSLVWGDVSQSFTPELVFFSGQEEMGGICSGFLFDNSFEDGADGRPIVFTPNTDVMGPLEGVCFSYFSQFPDIDIAFNAYDGDTIVASIPLPANAIDDEGIPIAATFGWRNTEGLNVTRFEFAVTSVVLGRPAGFVGDGQLAFGDGCDPPEATCFEQLGMVEADLDAFLDTLSGDDAYFAQGALDLVQYMQNDFFWEQPSQNRLSRYGGSLFIGAAYSVLYLEWVDDPEADVLIDELIAVLECIVDHEIAYAIENGGSQSFIDRAEDFALLAEIIDDDFDNEVIASLAYRIAWHNAYYATQ